MTSSGWLLVVYCALVLTASLVGGWLPLFVRLTHTRLQLAISFVAGLMLGIALLHFLPHAAEELQSLDRTVKWVLGGFLTMFFLQRFFHFHHHDISEGDPDDCKHDHMEQHERDHDHEGHGHVHHELTLAELQFHSHDPFKLSIALILGLGVAVLAGSVEHGHDHAEPAAPAVHSAH